MVGAEDEPGRGLGRLLSARWRDRPARPGGGNRAAGPAATVATAIVAQGDKNKDGKVDKAEVDAVADAWFDKLDAREEMEEGMLESAWEPRDNSRLSCQIHVTADLEGLVVRVPQHQGD